MEKPGQLYQLSRSARPTHALTYLDKEPALFKSNSKPPAPMDTP